MKDILEEIIAYKQIEVARQKNIVSPSLIYKRTEERINRDNELRSQNITTDSQSQTPTTRFSMTKHLCESPYGIIAEFKRKSPSKGWIKEEGNPEIIPLAYEKAGASAISILTDEKYFGGHLDFLQKARPLVHIPILRKEFIIDEYQLFEARLLGADAVLLIASGLKKETCKQLAHKAHELELEVLLEIHHENELDYITEHTDMIGVNNRNLGSFETQIETSFRLSTHLPQEFVLVSESGISDPKMVHLLRKAGFRGFLIGETFMKSLNPAVALQEFIKKLEEQK